MASTHLFGVVGDLDGDRHDEVELVDRLACPCATGADRVEEHVGVLGHERVAEPSVGDLAGELEVPRSERRDHHRDRFDRWHHRADPATRTVGWEVAHLAVMVEPVTPRDLADDLDRFAHRRDGLLERHTVPRLHDAWTTRPQPEHEATARQLLYRHRLHREHGRRAGTDLDDARHEPDRRSDGRQVGERRQRVLTPRLGDPDRRRAHPLALADELDVLVARHDCADAHLHTIDSRRRFRPPCERTGLPEARDL